MKTQFPFFETNPGITYLDSAATTLKPYGVIEAMDRYHRTSGLTVHRSLYPDATDQFEFVRTKLVTLFDKDVIFTSGATDSMNILAEGLVGDVLMGPNPHNSTYLPWARQTVERNCSHRRLIDQISERYNIIVVTDVNNVTGQEAPLQEIYERAHRQGCIVVVDATQSIAHRLPEYFDYVVFSAHKMYGPTGVGVICGDIEALKLTRFGSSNAIRDMRCGLPTYNPGIDRYEPGTPNVSGVIGLGAALDFLPNAHSVDLVKLMALLSSETRSLLDTKVKSHGTIMSIEMPRPYAFGEFLAKKGIYVRVGHHCVHLSRDPESVRVSFGCYNDLDDVDRFLEALKEYLK